MKNKASNKTARKAVKKTVASSGIPMNKKIFMIGGIIILAVIAIALISLSKLGKTGAAYTQPSCTDSDGGLNYEAKGRITMKDTTGVVASQADYCDGNTLYEMTCSGLYQGTNAYKCPGLCEDGKCIPKCDSTVLCSTSIETYGVTKYCRRYQEIWQWTPCAKCNGAGCSGVAGAKNYPIGEEMACEDKLAVCTDDNTWKACSSANIGKTTSVNGIIWLCVDMAGIHVWEGRPFH